MREESRHAAPQGGIDPALTARARRGDRDAFTALYEQTHAALYRSVRAMVRDEDLAWDILQESYLRAFRSLDKLEADEAFLPWLRRIAVNETARQSARRLPLCFTELEGEEEDRPELPDLNAEHQPELALDRKERARLVREILEQLPPQQQLILGLRYYEELSVREIAELLQLSPGTVKSQLHHGRKKVETEVRALEQQGVKLCGLGPVPFLMALLRKLEPAAAPEHRALETVLARLPAAGTETVTVTAKTAGSALLSGLGAKLAAGALALALIGGGVWAGGKLLQKNTPALGDYQPTQVQLLGSAEDPAQTTAAPADAERSEDLTQTEPVDPSSPEPDGTGEATEPDGTGAETEPTTESPTEPPAPADPTDPWSLLGELYDEDLGDGHVFRLPRFLAETEDADAMNAEIDRRFGETVRYALEDIEASHARWINYKACVWEDLLTAVIIEDEAEADWTDYAVYCYEVSTGRRLSTAALLDRMGISEIDFLKACRRRLQETFVEEYGTAEAQEVLPAEAYQQMLDRQLSDEYVNLELMAYPQDGELWVIAPALSIAGPEYFYVPLCLGFGESDTTELSTEELCTALERARAERERLQAEYPDQQPDAWGTVYRFERIDEEGCGFLAKLLRTEALTISEAELEQMRQSGGIMLPWEQYYRWSDSEAPAGAAEADLGPYGSVWLPEQDSPVLFRVEKAGDRYYFRQAGGEAGGRIEVWSSCRVRLPDGTRVLHSDGGAPTYLTLLGTILGLSGGEARLDPESSELLVWVP